MKLEHLFTKTIHVKNTFGDDPVSEVQIKLCYKSFQPNLLSLVCSPHSGISWPLENVEYVWTAIRGNWQLTMHKLVCGIPKPSLWKACCQIEYLCILQISGRVFWKKFPLSVDLHYRPDVMWISMWIPMLKITLEREISGCEWDQEEHNKTVDGNPKRFLCRLFWKVVHS